MEEPDPKFLHPPTRNPSESEETKLSRFVNLSIYTQHMKLFKFSYSYFSLDPSLRTIIQHPGISL
jgi:hypothetical protein